MSKPFKLRGAVAVITGGGSGIGRACALTFAERGASVVIGDLRGERAQEVAGQIEAAGGEAIGLAADVSKEADLVELRDTALRNFGHVDVVMNNVGILTMGTPEVLPDEAWERTIDVNLMGLARSNRVFLPALIAQGRGHLVNTASASGLLAYGFDRLPYVATKHAVVGITEALALYLTPKGVGVSCLCPSGVITNMMDDFTGYGQTTLAPRAPQHALSNPDEVGVLVADAIESGQFLITTAPEIHRELQERATDMESYMQARIKELNVG